MKVLLTAALFLCFSNCAYADDRYVIVGLRASPGQANMFTHDALVTDATNAGGRYCNAVSDLSDPNNPKVIQLNCGPIRLLQGAMPAGPVALSPAGQVVSLPALWKVDQTSGKVVFCQANSDADAWACRQAD